jgi:hypothetical protein
MRDVKVKVAMVITGATRSSRSLQKHLGNIGGEQSSVEYRGRSSGNTGSLLTKIVTLNFINFKRILQKIHKNKRNSG